MSSNPDGRLPLCVDLDGSLLAGDLLLLCLVSVLRRRPWLLLLTPFWLLGGRARLKRELALRAALEPSRLPLNAAVLEFLRAEKLAGRQLVLVTAADERLARPLAEWLGLFSRVLASDGVRNLKGERKARELVRLYGRGGFDYLGDSSDDLEVWSCARSAFVVSPSAGLLARVRRVAKVERVL